MNRLDRDISDCEIGRAEKILLPKGKIFDVQHRDVIKCLVTKDIKACPGSGKTTALLAKLLILVDRMPFADGRGICVLTHTNVAINEIRDRLGYKCNILFEHPNFFGTIQSFIDKFLAIPYFVQQYQARPIAIDDEIYKRKIMEKYKCTYSLKGFTRDENSRARYFIKANDSKFLSYRLNYDEDGNVILTNGLTGGNLRISKPNSRRNGNDFTEEERRRISRWLMLFKKRVFTEEHILCFDDCYFLANCLIRKSPNTINKVFSNRFKYVFIDEMQDTQKHQVDIIRKLFNSNVVIQQFGDPSQAIYDSPNSEGESSWNVQNTNFLPLSKTQRFGMAIANCIKTVCIDKCNDLQGNDDILSLPPHIIIFDDNTKNKVIERFVELIRMYNLDRFEEGEKKRPFKAIGWISKENTEKLERLSLSSYFPQYEKISQSKAGHYNNLLSYLRKSRVDELRQEGAKYYAERIMNAFLRILDIANVRTEEKRYFTTVSLKKYIEAKDPIAYLDFREKLAKWILHLNMGFEGNVYQDIKIYIKNRFQLFFVDFEYSDILNTFMEDVTQNTEPIKRCGNIYISGTESNEIKVEIGTIHSVKGETHRATLYLETAYADRSTNGHESERILEFMKGNYNENLVKKKITQRTLKVAYVGMSRPTHLLCVSIHQNRLKEDLDELESAGWKIDRRLVDG